MVLTAAIFTVFKATTKVAACGRHHKRGGAAFGRATSFVVSFVLALSTVIDMMNCLGVAIHCSLKLNFITLKYLFIDQKDREREQARLSREGEGRAPHPPDELPRDDELPNPLLGC